MGLCRKDTDIAGVGEKAWPLMGQKASSRGVGRDMVQRRGDVGVKLGECWLGMEEKGWLNKFSGSWSAQCLNRRFFLVFSKLFLPWWHRRLPLEMWVGRWC